MIISKRTNINKILPTLLQQNAEHKTACVAIRISLSVFHAGNCDHLIKKNNIINLKYQSQQTIKVSKSILDKICDPNT